MSFGEQSGLETWKGIHAAADGVHGAAEGVHLGSHAVQGMHNAWGAFANGATDVVPAVTSDAAAFLGGASTAESASHLAKGGLNAMNGLGGVLGAVGVGFGIHDMYEGASNLFGHGNGGDLTSEHGSQGGLQLLAGGLGTAAGIGGMGAAAVAAGATGGLGAAAGMASTLACPPLAIAAALAGLGAVGNEGAQRDGWYGTHTNEEGETENSTFFGSIAESASDVGHGISGGVHDVLGDNIASDVIGGGLGLIGGGIAGAGQSVWNAGAAVTHGIGDVGSAIASFFSDGRLKRDVTPIRGALDLLSRL